MMSIFTELISQREEAVAKLRCVQASGDTENVDAVQPEFRINASAI